MGLRRVASLPGLHWLGRRGAISVPALDETQQRLQGLDKSEWWLWCSEVTVTFLATVAYLLLTLPWLFNLDVPVFQLRPQETVPNLLSLVLLFGAFAAYRQWQFRQHRRQLSRSATETSTSSLETGKTAELSGLDPVTGLYARHVAPQRLAKEITRARWAKETLTFLVIGLDDFGRLKQEYGRAFSDRALQEFARRLRKATRGSDLVIRLGSDTFLLALPECGVGAAQRVSNRLNPVEVDCGSEKVTLTFSASSLEHEPGEVPEELLKRADQVLQLYRHAGQDVPS